MNQPRGSKKNSTLPLRQFDYCWALFRLNHDFSSCPAKMLPSYCYMPALPLLWTQTVPKVSSRGEYGQLGQHLIFPSKRSRHVAGIWCTQYVSRVVKYLISVWSWNFKDGGSLNAKFLAKNQHTQRNLFKKNPLMNYDSSKSAKIVLSNSIFYVKNQPNFFKKKFHLRISI